MVSTEAEVAAESHLVTVFDPVDEGGWLYADDHHLRPTGSRSLEAAWSAAITESLS